jgi:heme exporter protein D
MTLDLGGYGIYVWPAYGFAALVLLGLLAASLRAVIVHERALAHLHAPRRARATDPLVAEDGRGDGG